MLSHCLIAFHMVIYDEPFCQKAGFSRPFINKYYKKILVWQKRKRLEVSHVNTILLGERGGGEMPYSPFSVNNGKRHTFTKKFRMCGVWLGQATPTFLTHFLKCSKNRFLENYFLQILINNINIITFTYLKYMKNFSAHLKK